MPVFDNPGNARMGTAEHLVPRQPRLTNGRFTSGPWAWQWTGLAEMQSRLEAYTDELDQKRREAAQSFANDALQYMKANAPWKDRTGQARGTLMSEVVNDDANHLSTVFLGYGVFYGVFLETKTYGGRSYAILRPTVEYFKDRLSSYMEGL